MPKKKTAIEKRIESLTDREDTMYQDKKQILHDAGWTRSCDWPGALWLWSKTFPESTVQCRQYGGSLERRPHPPIEVKCASLDNALRIELEWQRNWI